MLTLAILDVKVKINWGTGDCIADVRSIQMNQCEFYNQGAYCNKSEVE